MSKNIPDPADFLKDKGTVNPNPNPNPNPELSDEDKKKQQKAPDENVAALRKARDELKNQLEEANKKLKDQEGITGKLEAIKPISEYIEKKEGKLDKEAVDNYINRNKSRKITLKEKEEALVERENRLKEISISESTEWKENYEKPIIQSRDNLIAIVSNFDKDGNQKHPELLKKLVRSITQVDDKGQTLSAIQIRSVITKFAEEYEKQTGEEYDAPRLNDVVDHVNSFINKYKASVEAKENWNKVTEENKKKKLIEEATKTEQQREDEIKSRNYIVNEYINNFDFESIKGVVDKDEFIKEVKEQHQYIIDSTRDPAKRTREYHQFIELNAKGKLFDNLVTKVKELSTALEQEKAKNRSSLPGGGNLPKEEKRESDKSIIKPGSDPMAFLKS